MHVTFQPTPSELLAGTFPAPLLSSSPGLLSRWLGSGYNTAGTPAAFQDHEEMLGAEARSDETARGGGAWIPYVWDLGCQGAPGLLPLCFFYVRQK